ncbi:FAD-binding protein, partial [Tepidibacter formicigenes]
MEMIYDLIVIGAGPAGLSAGLYGARAKMNTLIIEKDKTGGQIVTTDEVA